MVFDWSPEPPRGEEEESMSAPGQIIEAETDSDEEVLGNAPAGYELLLTHGPISDFTSDEEDESENETATSTAHNASMQNNIPSTSNGLAARPEANETRETDRLFSAPELRRDLTVDCDQVRAAMAGFALPPGAAPAWAAGIPEAELAAAMIRRIRGADAPEPPST